jgi:hypothetical protein
VTANRAVPPRQTWGASRLSFARLASSSAREPAASNIRSAGPPLPGVGPCGPPPGVTEPAVLRRTGIRPLSHAAHPQYRRPLSAYLGRCGGSSRWRPPTWPRPRIWQRSSPRRGAHALADCHGFHSLGNLRGAAIRPRSFPPVDSPREGGICLIDDLRMGRRAVWRSSSRDGAGTSSGAPPLCEPLVRRTVETATGSVMPWRPDLFSDWGRTPTRRCG